MDVEILKSSNQRISDTLKALNQALAKEERAKRVFAKARTDVATAKDAHLLALDDAKKAIV